MNTCDIPVENHPLEPFIPEGARLLMLGSFPPKKERWSMEFFYPNWINDMWRIWGLIFFDDKEYFTATDKNGSRVRKFDKARCMDFANGKGIAMYDTACKVRRLKDNASDKFLEIVQPTDLLELLGKMPDCQAIVTTGQKATDVIVGTFGCKEPEVGGYTECVIADRKIRFWRMPSSSRAYPLALEKKAEHYERMFRTEIEEKNFIKQTE